MELYMIYFFLKRYFRKQLTDRSDGALNSFCRSSAMNRSLLSVDIILGNNIYMLPVLNEWFICLGVWRVPLVILLFFFLKRSSSDGAGNHFDVLSKRYIYLSKFILKTFYFLFKAKDSIHSIIQQQT